MVRYLFGEGYAHPPPARDPPPPTLRDANHTERTTRCCAQDVGARLQLRERDDVRRLENLLLRILVDAQFVDAVAGEEAMNSRRWARGPKPRPPREVCALPWIFGGALHLGATREKYHKELKEHH